MYYGNIKKTDIADGDGVRVSLFVSGCRNCCKGCFQPETWDFKYGTEFTQETENQILEFLRPSYISGLTVLGGEPFEEENQRILAPFLRKVKETYPSKTIWCYTGYVLEKDLLPEDGRKHCEATGEMLKYIDILVDGPFIEEQKNISLKFRGSENQRILKLKEILL
ncbi:MAG: anaerobic ribonucleoside-triphosphate reductase activating protein [Treponema porcinum]|uniref:anaerobic ribonucleoside-triphosphate reductase activating protein n=1 Tax=Treponema porcinum TaxID=261392 RepID=UPI00235577B9|nr:anaerobic ribonucleoside-triphosphate reductase activating protein [Treponema porcinum]MCI5644425.1 anaerobic ribonucleoside-triphosphate reductase activating protein [Treponema porcinum]MDY5049253.1 anaerobic ribonucleoside-triphosphate reductase activating protein [Treponema porcinum]MDY5634543.1 anaerobic ribonucleoside-triphosphate reductase activating protein [Treponema porcinum]